MADVRVAVRQVDPGAAYRAHKDAIDDAVTRVLGSGRYLLDAEVRGFETEFASWLGIPHVLACASGTDALVLALRGLSIGPGCTVATVSHTSVATVAAIELAGAVPLLLDVESDHYTMDAAELAAVLAAPPPALPPIRAVIVVHLYGQAAELSTIADLCARQGVALIEDCCQAHGARYAERRVGTLGDAAAFSFYPTKNLAAMGDAGAVVTRRADIADRFLSLRQYGWRARQVSHEPGLNSRMDELQAAVVRVKLPTLDAANRRRRSIAAAFDAALAQASVHPPARRPGSEHVFHQYVVRSRQRDELQSRLAAAGIETAVHYRVPMHRQPAYADRAALGPSGCRITEGIVEEILSLPMYPELTDAQVEYVVGALRNNV